MAPRGAILLSAEHRPPSPRERACAPDESLVPGRRKTGIHQAAGLRQRRDGFSIFIVELHLQRVEVCLLAFGARSLRDRGNTILIEQPFQGHLSSADAMLAADRRQRLVRGRPALRQ